MMRKADISGPPYGRHWQGYRRTEYRREEVNVTLLNGRGIPWASPDEICEAKMDGNCPRCGHRGQFGEGGLCAFCGFSY